MKLSGGAKRKSVKNYEESLKDLGNTITEGNAHYRREKSIKFSMLLKLSCYQLKIGYITKDILCKTCGDHKEKPVVDTKKYCDKGAKAYHQSIPPLQSWNN